MTNTLLPGIVNSVVKDTVYALPNRRVLLFTESTTATLVLSNTQAFTASVTLTLDANGQAECAAGFIKLTSTTTPINVMVKEMI